MSLTLIFAFTILMLLAIPVGHALIISAVSPFWCRARFR